MVEQLNETDFAVTHMRRTATGLAATVTVGDARGTISYAVSRRIGERSWTLNSRRDVITDDAVITALHEAATQLDSGGQS